MAERHGVAAVVLYKSMFDAISILSDLLQNFCRIFVLKQTHVSCLAKFTGLLSREQFRFISRKYVEMLPIFHDMI